MKRIVLLVVAALTLAALSFSCKVVEPCPAYGQASAPQVEAQG